MGVPDNVDGVAEDEVAPFLVSGVWRLLALYSLDCSVGGALASHVKSESKANALANAAYPPWVACCFSASMCLADDIGLLLMVGL